jgi:hypothetical protein
LRLLCCLSLIPEEGDRGGPRMINSRHASSLAIISDSKNAMRIAVTTFEKRIEILRF